MPLLRIWLVIGGLFETPAAVYSFAGSRPVFPYTSHAANVNCKRLNGYNIDKWEHIFPALSPVMEKTAGLVLYVQMEVNRIYVRYAFSDDWQDNPAIAVINRAP